MPVSEALQTSRSDCERLISTVYTAKVSVCVCVVDASRITYAVGLDLVLHHLSLPLTLPETWMFHFAVDKDSISLNKTQDWGYRWTDLRLANLTERL